MNFYIILDFNLTKILIFVKHHLQLKQKQTIFLQGPSSIYPSAKLFVHSLRALPIAACSIWISCSCYQLNGVHILNIGLAFMMKQIAHLSLIFTVALQVSKFFLFITIRNLVNFLSLVFIPIVIRPDLNIILMKVLNQVTIEVDVSPIELGRYLKVIIHCKSILFTKYIVYNKI